MDFESPDVMKEFPGLYSTEANKKSNDSDYSDDVNEKHTKKDLLIGKRKDKKDNKKDRGYAALEGESSAEEEFESNPSKSKKTKSFKFTTKNKDKRDKIREKDVEKKKEKDNRKNDRCKEKVKCDKKEKKSKHVDDKVDIAEMLPIFGVSLPLAVERSRCHDGVDLPLPVRNCIDYVQECGVTVENVYKVSGIKSKVLHLKKLYNQREFVNLTDYDVPTATSLLKLFFRELPEPILGDSLTRFEEAAAIQNVSSREVSLISLVEKLPEYNRIVLAWVILHLDTITYNEKLTKMNAQSIAIAFSPILQMSHRLLSALLCHCKSLFKDTILFKYKPPLISSTLQLPEDVNDIMCELKKQESLLTQIHSEMNSGFISKKREELLWEVQRMITQLKRKLRSIQKCNELSQKSVEENQIPEESKMTKSLSCSDDDTLQQAAKSINRPPADHLQQHHYHPQQHQQPVTSHVLSVQHSTEAVTSEETNDSDTPQVTYATDIKTSDHVSNMVNVEQISCKKISPKLHLDDEHVDVLKPQISDTAISLMQHQNMALMDLKDSLLSQIAAEKSEIILLKYFIANNNNNQYQQQVLHPSKIDMDKLDEIMDLLGKENKILQIKKIDLVREIMEQREACIQLQSKIAVTSNVR